MNVVQSKYAYAVQVLNECFLMLFQIHYAKIQDGSTARNEEIVLYQLSLTCSHVFRLIFAFVYRCWGCYKKSNFLIQNP